MEILLFLLLWPFYLTIWIVTAMVGLAFSPLGLVLIVVVGAVVLLGAILSIPFKIVEEVRRARAVRGRQNQKARSSLLMTRSDRVVVSVLAGAIVLIVAVANFGAVWTAGVILLTAVSVGAWRYSNLEARSRSGSPRS